MTAPKKQESSVTFEQTLRRLEEIVTKLENGSVPLDECLKMYEEGVALSKACIEKLTQAELRLKTLSKDLSGNFHLREEETDEG